MRRGGGSADPMCDAGGIKKRGSGGGDFFPSLECVEADLGMENVFANVEEKRGTISFKLCCQKCYIDPKFLT